MVCLARFFAMVCALVAVIAPPTRAQNVNFGGATFSNKGLVGVGRVSADKKDKLGETFGSLSGLALDLRSWQRTAGGTYSGTLYTQPDRGYTKSGATTNYRPRRQKFAVTFKPDTNGSSNQDQLDLSLTETTPYAESGGTPLTSFDPTVTGSATRAGFPPLPQAFNGRLAIDPEGLALLSDGTFFVSDEYGPYLYRFAADGTLLGAVRPPEAFIPRRNGVESFSSDSPAAGQPAPSPSGPAAGRENSQGFEGLTLSADGRTLYALMQSALRQDGGSGGNSLRRYTRLVAYDVTNPASPVLTREWILPLPFFTQSSVQQVASVGDMVVLNPTQFLVLIRDGNGRGADVTKSISRSVMIYDVTNASNIAGTAFDTVNTAAAPNGVLASTIVPATSAVLVDLTDSSQLNQFNLNNSSNGNSDTLSDKWESLAFAPALDATTPNDYFLFVGNDNDFSTTDGFQDGGSYKAALNIDTMILVYRVTLPGALAAPSFITQPASRTVTLGQSATFTAAASGSPAPTFQWTKSGVNIPNATGASLTIPSAQSGDAASYSVVITNSNGSVASSIVTLTVNGANAPAFTASPTSQTVATGSTVVFSATASNSPSYSWFRDGVAIAGATTRTLVITSAKSTDAATYTVIASNSSGIVTSTAALTLVDVAPANAGRLINLSVLTSLASRSDNFSLGYVVSGASAANAKPVVIRAAGPSLGALGFPGTLDDPKLELFAGPTKTGENEDWGGATAITSAMAAVGAFAYVSPTARDAAVATNVISSDNSVKITTGVNSATGNGAVIAEVYDATPAGGFTASTPRLINFSVIKPIAAGGSLTLGFTLGGSTAKTVLIRAIGPGLAAVGVTSGTLGDPQLTLFNSSSVSIATNDDWGADAQLTTAGSRVGAFNIGSAQSKDAMLIITLPAGGYTARVTGGSNTSGLAIVEVYEVP